MQRVVVIVNKWFECDPVLATLLNPMAANLSAFPWPLLAPRQPIPGPTSPAPRPLPRAIFPFKTMQAEVWCIGDLLEQSDAQHQSSSETKVQLLPQIETYGKSPDLIISISTASSISKDESSNGCVVVGTNGFLHDGNTGLLPNPLSNWQDPRFGAILRSSFPQEAFTELFAAVPAAVEGTFAPVRNLSAQPLRLLANYENTALADVNITDPNQYNRADPDTVNAFNALGDATAIAGSVDTTHAVVRATLGDRFLFLSPIVNRLTHSSDDLFANQFPQENAACSNAGVTLKWLLTAIDRILF
jgi:hypothetical protein